MLSVQFVETFVRLSVEKYPVTGFHGADDGHMTPISERLQVQCPVSH